jgi:NADH dehydrogenase
VLIVGGGFGGLSAARALRRAPVQITLIDRRNHHLFQPLLYQVATATLSPADIAAPIRGILRRQRNAETLLSEVADFDLAAREVVLADGDRIGYDYLIVATGATHHYFGHPEWAEFAPGLKTIEDATQIRRRFLLAFEAAEQEPAPELRRALLTFVVIGGGPTGVEMAGAMAEISRHSLQRDFRRIDPSTARVILLEGGERLLAGYHPELSAKSEEALREIGVEVRTGSIVTRVEADAVYVGEERIPTRNVIWAAGVTASPLGGRLGVPTDRVGRVRVERDLSVPGYPELFVVGDLAAMYDAHGRPLPGVAPVANQQGKTAAANVVRSLAGKPPRPFRYHDRGSLATIGRRRAVLQTERVRVFGWVAWAAWLFIHIFFLIGFRNRVSVFLQWAWSYFTWQRGARLITGEVGPVLVRQGEPLGEPLPEEQTVREARATEAAGQTAPADGAGQGWMAGDRDQASGAA